MTPVDPDSRLAYRDMLRVARRLTSSDIDARDLVQEAVLVALERGMQDWCSPRHRAWLYGVLRRRWAFLARTSQRRRRRESEASPSEFSESKGWAWQPDFLASLPPSLRAVATLARADLTAREIRWLLDLSPTAFRARLSTLGKRVRAERDPSIEAPPKALEVSGAGRATVLQLLKRLPDRVMATQDPDGHVLFFGVRAHKKDVFGN